MRPQPAATVILARSSSRSPMMVMVVRRRAFCGRYGKRAGMCTHTGRTFHACWRPAHPFDADSIPLLEHQRAPVSHGMPAGPSLLIWCPSPISLFPDDTTTEGGQTNNYVVLRYDDRFIFMLHALLSGSTARTSWSAPKSGIRAWYTLLGPQHSVRP